MNRLLCSGAIFAILLTQTLHAQTGCPGCMVNLPPDLPLDTVYLPSLPDGQQGEVYNQDLSFRMPKTTTPVAALDSVTPPGLNITQIEILSIEGLPAGLSWEANQMIFPVATQTDGCIKICGMPTQTDSFVLQVTLRATVVFVTQISSFPMRLYIAPSASSTDGFSMTGHIDCGSATVNFVNNLPSNNEAGFSYSWDFGDGTGTLDENPAPHVYNVPGEYVVSYQATIDTVGYILQSVKILDVECVDLIGFGGPELDLVIKDASGAIVYEMPGNLDDVSLPVVVNIGLPLGPGNYTLEVTDEDGGIKGGDDDCGSVVFNLLSNDTLISGGFEAVFNIVHPVTEAYSTDTVIVYAQPAPPLVSAPNGVEACVGDPALILQSSYGSGNQWYRDGSVIPNATDSVYLADQTGEYTVRYLSADGCAAESTPVTVTIHPLPAVPVFINYNNRLQVYDSTALPQPYALQWLLDGEPIPGATGLRYCTMMGGAYGLQVTDLETGCINRYFVQTTYNPDYDCTVDANELNGFPAGWTITPNPAEDLLNLRFEQAIRQPIRMRIFDTHGVEIYAGWAEESATMHTVECALWPSGAYLVGLFSGDEVAYRKLIIAH